MRSWIIGGSADCDVVIDLPTVSAHHCRLTENENGTFILEDLQSTNGTYCNGNRIAHRVEVTRADAITLGKTTPIPWPQAPSAKSEMKADPASSKTITIGSAEDNDVVIDLPNISRHHAKINLSKSSNEIEDLQSTNGTYLNSFKNRISRSRITAEDILYLGSYRLPASRLLKKEADGPKPPTHMQVRSKAVLIGRDKSCGEVLDHPMVSNKHARFGVIGEHMYVEDLDSKNGTFVNGKRIHQRTDVVPGDLIQISSFTYRVNDGGNLTKKETKGNLSIESDGVSIFLGGKPLLDDVSLTIFPGEFVGLMGPSGAGKTLLLNALNGYLPPTSGQVLINGQNLYADYDLFRGQIGYVPQDDIVHGSLTVNQALYFTGKLRLPSDTSDEELKARVESILDQLGLAGVGDVLIGNATQRGISGGQRKRVNLAMELITDPSLLLLDEPTSGLSSADTLNVMHLLRDLANKGMTILMTIHQPSLEAYRKMDNLIIVAKDAGAKDPGRLAYYGPAYPDAIDYFRKSDSVSQSESPDMILEGLESKPALEWVEAFAHSEYQKNFVAKRSNQIKADNSLRNLQPLTPADALRQTLALTRRGFAIKMRDRFNTMLLLLQAPVIALLIVVVFGKNARTPMETDNLDSVPVALATTVFFLALSALWFGCSNSAREIVSEWAIYRRERMVNLKIPFYLASKFGVLGAFCLFQCIVLLVIVDLGCELATPWSWLLPVVFLSAMVGVGIGLTVSSFAKTSEVALGMLPLVILPMVILGGILLPIHKMPAIPETLAHAMPSRWAFEAILLSEAEHQEDVELPPSPEDQPADQKGMTAANKPKMFDLAEEFFPKDSYRMGSLAALMAVILSLVLVMLVPALILRKRDIH